MRTRLSHFLRDNWLFLLIVGAIAVAFLALRTSPTPLQSMDEVQAILEDGQPTLVEFYTNT
jgi:hypothetical protein